MAFVNEFVSEEDDKKYGLAAIDKRYFKGHYEPHWTRDRERDMYLRFMRDAGEEGMDKQTFVFYWKGTLIEVGLNNVRDEKSIGSKTMVWKMRGMGPMWMEKNPEVKAVTQKILQENKAEIAADLKEALMVYKDGGIYSLAHDLNVFFEF